MSRSITKADDYFVTAIDDIELEINEDKGLSLREVKSDYQQLTEEMHEHRRKMNKLNK
jgi:hypothetical protein